MGTLLLAIGLLVLAGLVVGGIYFAAGLLLFGGGGEVCHPRESATCSLSLALGSSYDEAGNFIPLTTFTAEYLNAHRRDPPSEGREFQERRREITYVGREQLSQGPDVVSVNVIDEFIWGAAARSRKSGRCYLILLVIDRSNPRFGGTKYGEASKDTPCMGGAATPETVTLENWPE